MTPVLLTALIAAVIIVGLVIAWILSAGKARTVLIRKESEVRMSEALRVSERAQHEKAVADLKAGQEKALADLTASHEKALAELRAGQEKAIEAAKTALALENEKILKAREEALKKEAAETMKALTGGLDQNIRDMKEAFEAQKKAHTEETSSIKTQFAETVRHLKEQTESIGNQAEDLARALKGQNKLQGNFGETILENMFRDMGLREGHDYESEYWLRDKDGNLVRNEETGRKMRPDFVLHFPDGRDDARLVGDRQHAQIGEEIRHLALAQGQDLCQTLGVGCRISGGGHVQVGQIASAVSGYKKLLADTV